MTFLSAKLYKLLNQWTMDGQSISTSSFLEIVQMEMDVGKSTAGFKQIRD